MQELQSVMTSFVRDSLIKLLDDRVPGIKALVLDPKLSGPLSLVAEFSLLKDRGVDKIYHLEDGPLMSTPCDKIIYLTRPKASLMKIIAKQIKGLESDHSDGSTTRRQYFIFMVPRQSIVCEKVLEDEGVFGSVQMDEFAFDLVPLEHDLYSLEWENSFADLFLRKNEECLFVLARALAKFQGILGTPQKISGRGEFSKKVSKLLINMMDESTGSKGQKLNSVPGGKNNLLEQIIIIDRNVDFVTPFCTPLTYEGLIDHFFGIHNTLVELDGKVSGFPDVKKFTLSAGKDAIFGELRNKNFSAVGKVLNEIAKAIHEHFEERHSAKTVSDLRNFVSKLGDLQTQQRLLKLHTNLTEELIRLTSKDEFDSFLGMEQNVISGMDSVEAYEYLDEIIDRQFPIDQIIRVAVLVSLTQRGLRPKLFDRFRQDIIQNYGFRYFTLLTNLEDMGLLVRNDSSRNLYQSLQKHLNLVVEDVNETDPTDISYVFSGYAPISVRILQIALGYAPISNVVVGGGGGSMLFSNPSRGTLTSSSFRSMDELLKGWNGGMGENFEETFGNNNVNVNANANSNAHKMKNINSNNNLINNGNISHKSITKNTNSNLSVKSFQPSTLSSNANVPKAQATAIAAASSSSNTLSPKTVIICFVGGVTISEIAAIRYLSKIDESKNYIICTTKLENYRSILDSISI